MEYKKRLTVPSKNNKYYYSNNVFYKSGYGMPNCTCYAWGRFYEITKTKPKLCTMNAEEWYKYNDGYKRGNTPKLGAIAVWSMGKVGNSRDGAGHVAVVEEIYSDGSFLTSNSAYRSTMFYTKKIGKYKKLYNYKFLGFIYPPIEFDINKIKELQSSLNLYNSKLVVDGIIGNKTTKAIKKHYNKKYIIMWVQKNLNNLGYNAGTIDGISGKNTKKAVRKYQSDNKLTVDGVAGVNTIKSICNK